MPAEQTVLQVTGLGVRYGRTTALTGADLTVGRGETVGVIGETGSGKSTLARAVVGLVAPATGTVTIAGEEVTAFGRRQWRAFRRRGVVQYVFQDPLRSLDPHLPVGTSVAEPLQLQGRSRADADAAARAQLERVHLAADLADRYPAELSGGQRQRVAVARALVTDPQLVVLDEPVSALDAANRVRVLEVLTELRETGTALVFISHDLGSVAGVSDRVAVLHRGAVVETAPTRSIVNDPQHPYTRLLVGSAPTLAAGAVDRETRAELRRQLLTVG
ncbi:ABC transporter ATP-binding protein [Pseudonocardia sp. MH-G8]|uniref:ABC transporter ATP-binding protein n=1 Tax=Pseudonocardia sp. MH-G8 TaxID=1854588 RepID=UPI000BA12A6F|nr:ABC transporter ATP-binding protein [Pseudonocardia sp. MH-G8]OZM77829.1 dipeptide/oligopeptide/nickel ABC transporter ATP-binding protein [Pseudonocardia sp. MH-G8]